MTNVQGDRVYICIDLKTFYASVECVERGLDPFTTNLVVADPERTQTTICLAITPAMKALGVRNRCRIFEIPAGISYITARPQMRRYMEVSADIYSIYLRYISPDDMHVYSIDECFIDATPYMTLYQTTPREFATMLMDAVYAETGICATAGIGTNLFLAKVALDIAAKHASDNIGFLDEEEFKRTVWYHRPITDIWNIGPGIARRLEKYGVYDLFGVCWLDEDVLYREFGANALYLIDHAHGVEPCTMADIHAYVPQSSSMTNGQILPCGYGYEEGLVVLREMVDASVLELIEKGLVAGHIGLAVGYEHERDAPGWNDKSSSRESLDHGRSRGDHTGGSRALSRKTSSLRWLLPCFEELYEQTTRRDRPIKRINLTLGDLLPEAFATIDLFTDEGAEAKERRMQEAVLAIKHRFGKNALLRGTSLTEAGTALERNALIGGHRA